VLQELAGVKLLVSGLLDLSVANTLAYYALKSLIMSVPGLSMSNHISFLSCNINLNAVS
jgi:hypothetical protein